MRGGSESEGSKDNNLNMNKEKQLPSSSLSSRGGSTSTLLRNEEYEHTSLLNVKKELSSDEIYVVKRDSSSQLLDKDKVREFI